MSLLIGSVGLGQSIPASAGLPQISGAVISSPVYIDASVFYTNDLCGAINSALISFAENYQNTSSLEGVIETAVIDARGISGALSCANSPWKPPSSSVNLWPPEATILLPAGTISISATWTLPGTTSIIGEGSAITILSATSSLANSDMIDMGTYQDANGNTFCYPNSANEADCQSIVIQHLQLSNSAHSVTNVNGIVNKYAEELSYVDDVAMTGMTGSGLTLGACYGTSCPSGPAAGAPGNTAANSGPYTKISYTGSGKCLDFLGSYGDARGIRGLTCTGTSSPATAIEIDSPNNLLQDVTINGYQDGIIVGSRAPAPGNVLKNISGSVTSGALVHISSNSGNSNGTSTNGASSTCPAFGSASNVCDLTVMGIGASSGNAVKDALTSTTISSTTDPSVAMYALGEQIEYGPGLLAGYSRYTTSTNGVGWYSGTTTPGTAPCTTGSLYSCTNTTNCTKTLWVCVSSGNWHGLE